MKLHVTVNDREVRVDPADLNAVREVEPGVYSILLNGASFEVRIAPEGTAYAVTAAGFQFTVEVRDPRDMAPRVSATPGRAHQEFRVPMPGKVIRVLVAEGSEVAAGQGLVVVEAMKMQNEMRAALPGRVTQVRAKEGDTVAAGDVLITIE